MKSYKGVKPNIQELLSYRYQAKVLKLFANQRVNTIMLAIIFLRLKVVVWILMRLGIIAGDYIRLMHWALTARLGKPYTKVYHEEHEDNLYFRSKYYNELWY